MGTSNPVCNGTKKFLAVQVRGYSFPIKDTDTDSVASRKKGGA